MNGSGKMEAYMLSLSVNEIEVNFVRKWGKAKYIGAICKNKTKKRLTDSYVMK
jgi:hypothetical protein